MRFSLMLVFIIITLTELIILLSLSGYIGIGWTIVIIIATAIVGTTVLRRQGLMTLARINQDMAQGAVPVEPVVEGFFILLAGAFLLTPGLLTDMVGFLLLIPVTRREIVRWSMKKIVTKIIVQRYDSSRTHQDESQPGWSQTKRNGDGPVIDGEFERIDEKTKRPPR